MAPLTAQSIGFDYESFSGYYIYELLDYAVYEEIDCTDMIYDFMPAIAENYLCIMDTDSVPFDQDLNAFFAENSNVVVSTPQWITGAVGQQVTNVVFTDGYNLLVVTSGDVTVLFGAFE